MEAITDFCLEYKIVESTKPCLTVIVAAAGSALRMGGSKQFIPLLGIPVLARTLMVFDKNPSVKNIVVVGRNDQLCDIQNIIDKYEISKISAVVEGGKTRFDSVLKGLEACPSGGGSSEDYIAIHDGARPLVTDEIIADALSIAKEHGAAAPAVPVKDTIKEADEKGKVLRTPERKSLFAVQTPQIFSRDIYEEAYKRAKGAMENGSSGIFSDGAKGGQPFFSKMPEFTDDCSIMEWAGYFVYLSKGSYENIKITTFEDVEIAEAVLKRRMTEGER